MQPINILFSSTVQWNVGDEFILRGILSVLREINVVCNPVLFNRNPVASTPWNPRIAWPSRPYVPPENSAQLSEDDPVDYVIFAGTPEWTGGIRSGKLHDYILRQNVRCSFLGVGLGSPEEPNETLARVLQERTDVFVARDTFAFNTASSANIPTERCSCPAILSCQTATQRPAQPRRIGMVLQSDKTLWHSIPTKVRTYLIQQFKILSAHYEPVYIAHYLDDLALAKSLNLPCRYSFRAEDFESLYEDCDLVISTRVHGAGIAASLGIPSILISHDGRAETGQGFGAIIAKPETDLLPLVQSTDWAKRSQNVISLKESAFTFYQKKLRSIPSLG